VPNLAHQQADEKVIFGFAPYDGHPNSQYKKYLKSFPLGQSLLLGEVISSAEALQYCET
jgi:hypothetical protein